VARARSTPYGAQINRLLASDEELTVFSAATLEERFDHPQHQKRTTSIAGIHKALRKAFSEGRLIAFVDEKGAVLRERTIVLPGSKAVGQPQMFARPGTASPERAFHAVTYEETVRRGLSVDSDEPASTEDSDDGSRALHDGEDRDDDAQEASVETAGSEDVEPEIPLEEARTRLGSYPPEKATAPEWVDARLLRAWASVPDVAKRMVHGLEAAVGIDRFELIRAGVTRKQRSWRSESVVAGNLADLARVSPGVWLNIARAALGYYISVPAGVGPAELPALACNPLDFYEESDHAPEAVVLCAMALQVDESILELIGADAASELGELKVEERGSGQHERIQILEAEAIELRRIAKEADRSLKAAQRRAQAHSEEIKQLRSAQAELGSAADAAHAEADEHLLRRAEQAEEALEKLEAERIPELEAALEDLGDVQVRLESTTTDLHEERRLRSQAEEDAKRHNARARELTDRLSQIAGNRNLPVEDAAALIDALARPIGLAARHAAERLAAARARTHDDLLLELASTVAQMTRRLDADADLPAATVEESDAEPTGWPVDGTAEEVEPPPAEPESEPPVAEPEARPAATLASSDDVSDAGLHNRGRRRRTSRLKIRALGGAGEIGGSAFLVTNTSSQAVLLDCGQRVRGEYGMDTEPAFHRRVGHEGRLHGILISHSHIDHVGSLPIVHREQSQAQHEPIPIWMTAPTRRLAEIMLEDSAKIQQHREGDKAEAGYLDYGVGAMEAAYRIADVKRVLDDEFVREATPGLAIPIPETSFVARFLPVAHVLGSCAIHLTDTDNDQTLLYTGDLGPINDPQATLPQYALSEMLAADLVIMESTYGAQPQEFTDGRQRRRRLSPRESAIKQLCERAQRAHDKGGCVLLPAFSLGRTQELAMLIDQARRDGEAPAGEIVVGGMGERITQVYEAYSKGANAWARAQDMPRVDELGGRLKHRDLTFGEVAGEVLAGDFTYIIASPAMLGSGWSRTFLDQMVDNPAHSIVMSGYVPRNAGHIPRLHQLHHGDMINLDGTNRRIQAQFDQLKGLSAHAPAVDLRQFADYMSRHGHNVAFGMVHGDEAAQLALAADVGALPEVALAESLHNSQVWQPRRP
jgi:predicted metal-dependent RNase